MSQVDTSFPASELASEESPIPGGRGRVRSDLEDRGRSLTAILAYWNQLCTWTGRLFGPAFGPEYEQLTDKAKGLAASPDDGWEEDALRQGIVPIPADAVLQLQFELPTRSIAEAHRMAMLRLPRASPLPLNQLAISVSPSGEGPQPATSANYLIHLVRKTSLSEARNRTDLPQIAGFAARMRTQGDFPLLALFQDEAAINEARRVTGRNVIAAIVLCALANLAAASWVWRADRGTIALEAELETAQEAAQTQTARLVTVEQALAAFGSGALSDSADRHLAALAQIARQMPPDTTLRSLRIAGGIVELTGESRDPTAVQAAFASSAAAAPAGPMPGSAPGAGPAPGQGPMPPMGPQGTMNPPPVQPGPPQPASSVAMSAPSQLPSTAGWQPVSVRFSLPMISSLTAAPREGQP